ncbi:MAG: nuclear transport factor 2 family protein [candidate division Zixibacteria bacterium]|nr:nuclear transport factor 2 family protein [candidate division Zixibacteria bacterium]MDH3936462.1 nuclear transport factor 2 family protein [candidate division Zixibacteria bacterium]MDH4033107.1 nuclear transport factor 2 family protein [candidate division Zixibacteria bacterium]
MTDTQRADREKIIGHIHCIFQSFLKRDREAIKKAHTEDWVGFLGPSVGIERGIDAYMANVDKSLESFKGTGFELLDTEVQLYGDLALVYYVARYQYEGEDGSSHSLPLRSVDVYRRESGDWIQAGSHITVIPTGGAWGQASRP